MDSIDLVISSDLKRAVDSADYTFKGAKEILHDARIRECNYGDLNGKDTSLVKYEDHIVDRISWNKAIEKDWRKIKAWQPGWEYLVK